MVAPSQDHPRSCAAPRALPTQQGLQASGRGPSPVPGTSPHLSLPAAWLGGPPAARPRCFLTGEGAMRFSLRLHHEEALGPRFESRSWGHRSRLHRPPRKPLPGGLRLCPASGPRLGGTKAPGFCRGLSVGVTCPSPATSCWLGSRRPGLCPRGKADHQCACRPRARGLRHGGSPLASHHAFRDRLL